ncbi:DUF1850 domain-containing protein [Roseivivax sp. CAU 1761]
MRRRASTLRGTGRAALAALLVAAAPAPAGASDPDAAWLCLSETRGRQAEIARLPLGPGRDFELSFIHSVSRTRVRDSYRIDRGEIVQLRETYLAHGAGLPSGAEAPDATRWRHEGGRFILDMHRRTGPIALRVQPEFENMLHTDGTDLALADLGRRALTLAPCDEETPQ